MAIAKCSRMELVEGNKDLGTEYQWKVYRRMDFKVRNPRDIYTSLETDKKGVGNNAKHAKVMPSHTK